MVQTTRGHVNDKHRPSTSPCTRIKTKIRRDHNVHSVHILLYRQRKKNIAAFPGQNRTSHLNSLCLCVLFAHLQSEMIQAVMIVQGRREAPGGRKDRH